jgi:hypothetical protein
MMFSFIFFTNINDRYSNIFYLGQTVVKTRNFTMIYRQTFQHRARLSILRKNNISPSSTIQLYNFQKYSNLPFSQLTRKKMSFSKKGKKLKKNVKLKISESLKGRLFSDKHKNNLRLALSGLKNPMFGRTHSKFIRRKISISLIGKNN